MSGDLTGLHRLAAFATAAELRCHHAFKISSRYRKQCGDAELVFLEVQHVQHITIPLQAMTMETVTLRENALPKHVQALISQEIFGTAEVDSLRPYFRYYSQQCKSMSAMATMHGQKFPLANHAELLDLVQKIRSGVPHADIKAELVAANPASVENLIHNSIDLALRLLLMVDIGRFDYAFTGRDTITWTSGTIRDLIGTIDFFSGRPGLPSEGLKLENSFNIVNIERFAGFDVCLTTNLKDHLLVREDIKSVSIFHYASFLQHQRDLTTMFPPGFVEETLQTISLLFPKSDKKVERWYRRKASSEELDMAVLKCGTVIRHIEKYRFWRDRLVQLKEAFDDTRPRTVLQWWNDRRDGVQWWTFWAVISLTIFFGLVQSIEGAVQVYKAYNPS
ncbi:hypothetical protein KJ359_007623 [Pestalotiopsis sp. 9143b]|nr:hypothetical protein KJ359_007623 [Pestalotiopsis sp. 9143b]